MRLPTPPSTLCYDPTWELILKKKSMFSNPENAFFAQPDNITRHSMLANTYDDAQKTDGGILFCSKKLDSNTLVLEAFHHIKRSSSPLAPLKKDDKFFGVQSLHNNIVTLPIPTEINVFSKVAVPCDEDILSISSKEEFDLAKPKSKNPTRISTWPCVSIPAECIIEVSKQADINHAFEIFMIIKD